MMEARLQSARQQANDKCTKYNTHQQVFLLFLSIFVRFVVFLYLLNLKCIIRYVVIIDVGVFVTLHVIDHTDGDGQGEDFIESLGYHLGHHEADEYIERYFGFSLYDGREDVEGEGEEDDGVGTFAHDGRCDGTEGEIVVLVPFVAVGELHLTHDPCIEERAYDEGNEAGYGDLWGEHEDLLEGRVASCFQRWEETGDGAHDDHEEVHQEACPDDEACLTVAPHLCDTVVEDVRDGEDDETAGERYVAPDAEYLGFQQVGSDESHTEEDSHQHEEDTDGPSLLPLKGG